MGLASFSGQMAHSTMENGEIIKCMVKANFDGPMEEFIMVNTSTIKNMAKEFTHGQTVACTKDNSSTENSMAKEYIAKIMAKKFTAFGKKEKRSRYSKVNKNLWKWNHSQMKMQQKVLILQMELVVE